MITLADQIFETYYPRERQICCMVGKLLIRFYGHLTNEIYIK